MSYYKSHYYKRSRKKYNRYNYNELSSRYADITLYLKGEFFKIDEITFYNVSNLYKALYGDNAYRYLLSNYNNWKLGIVGISKQTTQRILECVPKFLSDEKRFYVLKCEILNIIASIHSRQRNKVVDSTQLTSLFVEYLKEIESINEGNLIWFVGRGIFNNAEILQFLNVCKYALYEKVKLSYHQSIEDVEDIELIKQKVGGLNIKILKCQYQIDFLKSTVDFTLSSTNNSSNVDFNLDTHPITLEGTFKKYTELYILEELMDLDFIEKEGIENHTLQSQDIDLFLSQFNELTSQPNQSVVTASGEFRGEGGFLKLCLEKRRKFWSTLFQGIKNL